MSEDRKSPSRPTRGLGRGLSALLGDGAPNPPTAAAQPPAATASPATHAGPTAAELDALRRESYMVPIEFLKPGRFQPRRLFDEDALAQLAQSIRERGLLQPFLARQTGKDSYEILAGERRWRAAQLAKLHEVPVVLREFTDREALEIALIENLQRQDLSPVEEAQGYARLRDEFKATQADLADVLGKSRSHITNMLRLLELPEKVRALLDAGRLTAGHARALIGVKDIGALAQKVADEGLSVRQVEKMVQTSVGGPRAPSHGSAAKKKGWSEHTLPIATNMPKSADVKALEMQLEEALGLRIDIAARGDERTQVTLFCDDYEQLDDVVARLSKAPRA